MSLRSTGVWVVAAVGLAAAGVGAAMAVSLPAAWHGAALRLWASAAEVGRRPLMAVLIPIIAMSASYHVGSRFGRRGLRRPEARAAVATQPPLVRYAILFALAALAAIVMVAVQAGR